MKTLNLFYVLILIVLTNSCAEMAAAMSNVTADTCMYQACVSSAYDYKSEKYLEGTYVLNTKDGDDVSYSELRWVKNRQSYYNNLPNFGVWYERSPYSRVDYRFSTYCTQYSNNYGW